MDKLLGIISQNVVSANQEATAVDIARLMKEHNIGAIAIMENDKVIGIVSERDLTTRVIANALSAENTKVKDFMTREVLTVDFKEGLNKIYQTLCEIDFRHLLIMNDKKLVGITSRRDLLDALAAKKR